LGNVYENKNLFGIILIIAVIYLIVKKRGSAEAPVKPVKK